MDRSNVAMKELPRDLYEKEQPWLQIDRVSHFLSMIPGENGE